MSNKLYDPFEAKRIKDKTDKRIIWFCILVIAYFAFGVLLRGG